MVTWLWKRDHIFQSLMGPFFMVVIDEFLHRVPQRSLTKQNQMVEAFFFDCANKPFCKGIQIR